MPILPNTRPSTQRQLILDQVRKEIKTEVEEAIKISFAGNLGFESGGVGYPNCGSSSSLFHHTQPFEQIVENFELQFVPRINRSKQRQTEPVHFLHMISRMGSNTGLEVEFFRHKKVIVTTYDFF